MIRKLGRSTSLLNRCRILVVGMLMALLAGCPPVSHSPKVIPGEWAFSIFDSNGMPVIHDPASIILIEDGTTNTDPPNRVLTFTGTATWMQDGETFFLQHIKDGSETEYTGTVFAPTYMEGSLHQTVGGSFVGSWTATFVTR